MPVNVMVMLVEAPLQMVVVPLNAEVGRLVTVITALPLMSAGLAVHLLSVAAVTI